MRDFALLLQTIVTGAEDETLGFWDVFPSSKSKLRKMSLIDDIDC